MSIWSWPNNYQEKHMNKDQIKGRVEEAKGNVKEVTGKLLDNDDMELEGNLQKNIGKVKAGFGDLKDDINKANKTCCAALSRLTALQDTRK
jgi:uncharacterized protein YjbJ (UPF0337 family)